MATIRFEREPFQIDTVIWTGSNFDEIIAFAGAAFVEYVYGELRVNGLVIASGESVSKMVSGGQLGRVTDAELDTYYTEVV